MFQELNPPRGRTNVRRLSVYFTVLAFLLLTIAVPVAGAQACNVIYTISPQNTSAFGAAITIQNTGTTAWTSWTLTWTFANGQTVSQLWNGIETQSGAAVTVKNEPYNGSVAAGGSVQGVGFNGTWNGTTNAVPASFAVNGVTCGGTLTATTTTLAASTTTPAVGASVTLTATVAPTAATGTVTFYSGTTSLGTGTLASGKATLTTSFATAGTYSLTAVYAGSTTYATSTSTAVSVTVGSTGSFTLGVSGTPTVVQGSSTTLTITVTDVSPFSGTVTLSYPAASGGITISGCTSPITGNGSCVLTITASSTATVGGFAFTLTGTSGTLTSSATLTLTVTAKPGFTISCGGLTVVAGGTGTCPITVTDTGGFTGSVTLAASGLPTGVTAAFSTNPTTTTSVLTITASSAATPGTFTITITGTSGTTTYTITCTITITAPVTANAVVTVNPANTGVAVSNTILGMNLASWYDVIANDAGITSAFEANGIKAVRWPGGSWSDIYHWSTNTNCFSSTDGAPAANDTFANFVNDIAIPAGLDVSLTADYGTNAACTGGGDPTEAASWAAQAVTLKANVSHITVGNEEYGTWEEDLHSPAHDPTTYANAVATGYYPDIKAASPNVLVGVLVQPDYTWDSIVLANAKYDFVEFHYYPETPGSENDTTLIQTGATGLTTYINKIKTELTTAGHSGTPIYVGEIGAPYSNPGKQSWSITQGLYAGQVLGEMMNDGVTRLTWWIGFGNCNGQAGNDSSSLYGWQNFGAYNVFSDGPSDPTCPSGSTAPDWGPIGTPSPTGRAFQLFSQVAVNGEKVLTPTVTGDTTDVVAYAATHSGGTALVLFNRNETTSETVQITVTGVTSAAGVTETTYNKALYDETDATTPVWAAPTTTSLGTQTLPMTLTLTPWSMNVVIIP